MPRRSHVKVGPGEGIENIEPYEISITLPAEAHQYLTLLAALLYEKSGRKRTYSKQDIIRSLIESHRVRNFVLEMQLTPED